MKGGGTDDMKSMFKEKMTKLGVFSNMISSLDALFEQSYNQTKNNYENDYGISDINIKSDESTKSEFLENVMKRFLYGLKDQQKDILAQNLVYKAMKHMNA